MGHQFDRRPRSKTMLGSRTLAISALLLLGVSATASSRSSGAPSDVSWAVIRKEISQSVCVTSSRSEGEEYRSPQIGPRENCGGPVAATPVAKAVDKAIREAALPLLLAQPADVGFDVDSNAPLADSTRKWRDACLASDLVIRPILAFLPKALAEEGLTCEGCPSTALAPSRHASWSDLAPYVGAYFWPNQVKTPVGSAGLPSGKPEYGYHICVGINGLEGIDHLDPELARAGLIVAKGSPELRAAARDHFRSILDSTQFRTMDNDDEWTAYLRGHLPAAVARDPIARRAACDLLGRFDTAVGVALDDCGAAKSPRGLPTANPSLKPAGRDSPAARVGASPRLATARAPVPPESAAPAPNYEACAR